jgi:hypothetical protein
MSATLLEWAIAILLLWIAWRIGAMLAPWIVRRLRDSYHGWQRPPDRKNKPPYSPDTEK